MSKTVLFQTIRISICRQFRSIWPIDIALSGATTASQSGTGSDGNKVLLSIPKISNITGVSPSDCLESYAVHSLEESYLSAEIQSVFLQSKPTAPK